MKLRSALKRTVWVLALSTIAVAGSARATASTASAATSAASGYIAGTPSSSTSVQCYPGYMRGITTANPEPGYAAQKFGTRYSLHRWNGSAWVWQKAVLANAPGVAGYGLWTEADLTISTKGYYAISTQIIWFGSDGVTGTNYAHRWANQYSYYRPVGDNWLTTATFDPAGTKYCTYN